MKLPAENLTDPSLYLDRELSLLEFNARVLAQVRDPEVPLLERLRFLSICSTNLDEFFEIRVSGLKEQLALGTADEEAIEDLLGQISVRAHDIVAAQYRTLSDELLPALAKQGISVLARDEWTKPQRRWVKAYFRTHVLPVLTPMGLDPAHPFPKIQNKGLNFVLSLAGRDAFGRTSGMAIVQVPRSLPRVIQIPQEVAGAPLCFVMLSSVIHSRMKDVFSGMKVLGCFQFRVTRNSELWVDEEEVDDLLRALQGELPERRFGDAVRLEVSSRCPEEIIAFLLEHFALSRGDLYQVSGPVNLHRIAAIYQEVKRADLKYPAFVPSLSPKLGFGKDLFDVLSREDVVLHHPYESFSPVLELLRQAAADPKVLAIKQTLYRTGSDSPVVDALINASRAGKEVTVVIELRARFDEAQNIDLATRLQTAGVHVAYGVVGFKTHAKLLMIVRREGERLVRYMHLGTGNYHAGTARAYTDLGFLTSRADIGEDVHDLFLQLTGMGRAIALTKLLQAPFTLHAGLLELIEAETREAQAKRPARIAARMNALTEKQIIQALYRASQAGVVIDLVVRGACCLRPGVPGVSENIRVRSIVGRFLEHSRTYHFHAAGRELLFCSSADWMERNFFRRVEASFPIEDPALKARIRTECLDLYLEDDTQAWELEASGRYRRVTSRSSPKTVAQETLLARLAELPHGQAPARPVEQKALFVEVGPGERVPIEPIVGKGELERVLPTFPGRLGADGQSERRQGLAGSTPVESNGDPQEDDEALS